MNTQSTVETFTQWYQSKQAMIAEQPVKVSIDYAGQHCFLVIVPGATDLSWEERAMLARHLLTDYVAEFEEAVGGSGA